MSPGFVRGVAGTGGMTSSSGSPADERITSISPVEKPVSVGSISTSMRSEFAQFQLQDFQVPAGIERNLVVGDPERSLLGLREAGQDDSRDLGEPQSPARPEAGHGPR